MINILPPSAPKYENLACFVSSIRGKKGFVKSNLQHLQPFESTLLDTETSFNLKHNFGIICEHVLMCKRIIFKNVIYCTRLYGQKLKSSDYTVTYLTNNGSKAFGIIESIYFIDSQYFIKIQNYKNTGNNTNEIFKNLNNHDDVKIINSMFNQFYFNVKQCNEYIILPISCLVRKAIFILIDEFIVATEFLFEQEHD